MSEHGVFGSRLAQQPSAVRAIERAATGVTAFVGRTLKGPLHSPVPIASFPEFERTFGGLWQPSSLSYAIEQFYENGGRRAIVVRVANGAHPPTLSLPAGGDALRLTGINPGSREYLRAAVDYDGIGDDECDRFNLVLQRVAAPRTERIEDQEIVRRASIEPGSARFIADLLLDSGLVRLQGSAPRARPDPTTHGRGYVSCELDGSDGAPLSDYDVIGSSANGTGLWALQSAEPFDLLCIPPLSRDDDVGLATLYVASRFCRERRAMLLVDPPSAWSTPERALSAVHAWPFRSEHAAMFYPRVSAHDRLRGRAEIFGSAACAAGLLARRDDAAPVWAPAGAQEPTLRPGTRPAVPVEASQRLRLSRAGINTLLGARSSGASAIGPRTLAGDAAGSADWRHLAARRLANLVVASIERGLDSSAHKALECREARKRVESFLYGLHREGAFAGRSPEESYFVVCDDRLGRREAAAGGPAQLLFGIAPVRPGEFHAWLLPCRGAIGRARPVAVNRFAASPQRVDWEIETAILRALGPGGHA